MLSVEIAVSRLLVTRSHVLRGNAVRTLRVHQSKPVVLDAKRPGLRSHAKRGNELFYLAIGLILPNQ